MISPIREIAKADTPATTPGIVLTGSADNECSSQPMTPHTKSVKMITKKLLSCRSLKKILTAMNMPHTIETRCQTALKSSSRIMLRKKFHARLPPESPIAEGVAD